MTFKRVQETDIGVYVALSDGLPISDGEGHVLSIDAREGDFNRIVLLRKVAAGMGYQNLDVEFIDSVRKVSDEEYLVQQQRMEAGLVPDVYDVGEFMDSRRSGK